ncbi:hypothetical protein SAMN04487948_12712 [Halogranum amylolyticum]|uniref:Uncharacterized protein n=1 Tax=Halogranum amylolyticum TaxID=660520 RepID=A0A1H8WC56_9EURY|nr:hypothetical protein SAMN04487948_12712 [Halogranum amylolyticum]
MLNFVETILNGLKTKDSFFIDIGKIHTIRQLSTCCRIHHRPLVSNHLTHLFVYSLRTAQCPSLVYNEDKLA